MDAVIQHATSLRGTPTIPPDKAICHRAVLLAALADGATSIRPWPAADDCQRTLELVKSLGVNVTSDAGGVTIHGVGWRALEAPRAPLACGESGTTLRLAAGVLAGQPFASTLSAGPALSRRPMRRIVEPLAQMGVVIHGRSEAGRPQEVYPPLTVHGRRPVAAIRYELPVASAQVKSAVLLAGLFAPGPTTVVERCPTRDHTERALRAFGARVTSHPPDVTIEPGLLTSPGALALPGDLSSAAFFLVAACCVRGSRVTLQGVGLNRTRAGILNALRRMGASIEVTQEADGAWEPRGTLTAQASTLLGTTIEPSEVPGLIDELPVLMVAAACARGTTTFRGVGELRVKETDRIHAMMAGLGRMGARVRAIEPDTVEVDGGGTLRGAAVDSAGDHRTAMSLAVAGLAAQGTTTIRGAECVAKSFPDFFTRLGALAGSPTVKTG